MIEICQPNKCNNNIQVRMSFCARGGDEKSVRFLLNAALIDFAAGTGEPGTFAQY